MLTENKEMQLFIFKNGSKIIRNYSEIIDGKEEFKIERSSTNISTRYMEN